jgi:prevent-host-death family protein
MYDSDETRGSGHVRISEARDGFAELVNRVSYGHERIRVARRGREVAALVPIADIELLELLEDALDLEAVREAMSDPENADPIPWEQVRDRLRG